MLCVFGCSNWWLPHLPLLGIPYSLKHNIEIKPINPTVASKHSSESKSCISLTLNQKLDMIKLRDKVMLKAEISWKQSFLHQSCKCKGRVPERNEKCFSSEHKNHEKALHRLQYNVNITFICSGEPKFLWLTLLWFPLFWGSGIDPAITLRYICTSYHLKW